MKAIKLFIIISGLMININAYAQQPVAVDPASTNKDQKSPGKKDKISSKFSISLGAGVANYFGDLLEANRFYSQSGFAFGAGASYAFANHFSAGLDLGVQQVKAADNKNTGAQFKARNLSFKSNVYDVSVSLSYNLLNMNKTYPFSPYFSAGAGIMLFNPYANSLAGKKQYLRELGTEGQGLAGYPGMYSKTVVIFPVAFGFKYNITPRLMVGAEFKYRFTETDHLDDVSANAYAPKPLLDARNPVTAKFTYRGNEVGGPVYPANLTLPRGNPDNNDGYYSTLFKVAYKFKAKSKKSKDVEPSVPVAPAVLPSIDKDGDGVVDFADKCPDVPGKVVLEGCPDADGDGVADKDDKCKDIAGDSRYDGCPVPDTDGDGINDDTDKCKTEKGSKEKGGCPPPDKDADGITDAEDKCPDTKGSTENNGCPLPFIGGAELTKVTADSMTYSIYFDFNRAFLLPDAFKVLKRIQEILLADKSLHINIAGHADNSGTDAFNMNLSSERAYVVRDYFLSYYIGAGRIKTSYYGSGRPVDDVQQWRNRRVEITIIKK